MTLLRVNPFRELEDMQGLLSRFMGGRTIPARTGGRIDESWSPRVDVSETPTEVSFSVDLPGFEKSDIEISLDQGILSLSGERTFEKEETRDYHFVEKSYGKFFRSFRLPSSVDSEKIAAGLKHGVLTINLPKKKEAKPRQIPVKVS